MMAKQATRKLLNKWKLKQIIIIGKEGEIDVGGSETTIYNQKNLLLYYQAANEH